MKSLLILIIFVAAFSSCSKDETDTFSDFPQKWELVKMTGSFDNSESVGDDMDWQEYYLFEADSTFIKHRERDGVIYEESGTFFVQNSEDKKYIILDFAEDNEIIGNCYNNQTETLLLKSESQLIGTWQACDGPGLEYELAN